MGGDGGDDATNRAETNDRALSEGTTRDDATATPQRTSARPVPRREHLPGTEQGRAESPDRCPCNSDRESAMVVIRRDANGTPVVWCDPCIESIVRALNDAGIPTVASCCGHREKPGTIALADGRELRIMPNYDAARVEDRLATEVKRLTAERNERDSLRARVGELEREKAWEHRERMRLDGLRAELVQERDIAREREQQLVRDINREKYEHLAAIDQRDTALRERDEARAEADRLRRVHAVAQRVVSRGIHRRQDHRGPVFREVMLLMNDILVLGELAKAVEAAGKEQK